MIVKEKTTTKNNNKKQHHQQQKSKKQNTRSNMDISGLRNIDVTKIEKLKHSALKKT